MSRREAERARGPKRQPRDTILFTMLVRAHVAVFLSTPEGCMREKVAEKRGEKF